MAMIKVRAVEGRVAYDMPRGGKIIPVNKAVSVLDSPWIRRLANVQKDILIVEDAPAAAPPAPEAPPATEVPAA